MQIYGVLEVIDIELFNYILLLLYTANNNLNNHHEKSSCLGDEPIPCV